MHRSCAIKKNVPKLSLNTAIISSLEHWACNPKVLGSRFKWWRQEEHPVIIAPVSRGKNLAGLPALWETFLPSQQWDQLHGSGSKTRTGKKCKQTSQHFRSGWWHNIVYGFRSIVKLPVFGIPCHIRVVILHQSMTYKNAPVDTRQCFTIQPWTIWNWTFRVMFY